MSDSLSLPCLTVIWLRVSATNLVVRVPSIRDAFIAASVNYFASFIAGLVVFALLGYMATIMDVSISDVATEGKLR